jgi:hypothetical protein
MSFFSLVFTLELQEKGISHTFQRQNIKEINTMWLKFKIF